MAELAALSWPVLGFCTFAVFIGTILQRLAGAGLGLVVSPSLAIVAPEFLPATVLMLGFVVGLGSAAFEMSAVDRKELPAGFAGRALGAMGAAWLATQIVDTAVFSWLIVGVVYLGVALSLLGLRVAINATTLFSSGFAAGVMGTLTAVGAPPMALLYQHEEQRRSAAMQNVFFLFGMVISVSSLAIAGLIAWRHIVMAAMLLPSVAVGLLVAHRLAPRAAKASIRPWALGLAGLAATALAARQLV